MTEREQMVKEKLKQVLKLAQEPDAKEGAISFEDFWASGILHFEDEEGNRLLAVVAKDQSLPFFRDMACSPAEIQYQDGYKQGQQGLLKDNFVKIEKGE